MYVCSSLRNKTCLIYLALILINLHWFGATTTCQPFISRWHLDHIWSFYRFTFDQVRIDELVRRLDSVEMAVSKIMSKWMMDPWKMMDFFQFLLDVGWEEMPSNVKDKGTYEKNMKNTCHLWHVSCYSFERHLSPSCRLIAWRFHTLPRATERLSVNKGGQCHKGHLFGSNRSQINKWKIRWSWNILKHSLQTFANNTQWSNKDMPILIFSANWDLTDAAKLHSPSRRSVRLRSWQLGIFPSSMLDGHLRVGPQLRCLEGSVFVSFVSKKILKHWNYIWNFSIVFVGIVKFVNMFWFLLVAISLSTQYHAKSPCVMTCTACKNRKAETWNASRWTWNITFLITSTYQPYK